MPFVLSTDIAIPPQPTARLLDPVSAEPLAEFPVPAGSLLGGAYAYLNPQDEMVLVDGSGNLLNLAASQSANGKWNIQEKSFPIGDYIGNNDPIISLAPAGNENELMIVSSKAKVALYNPNNTDDPIRLIQLGKGETIANSFSTTDDGRAAIVTDKALYMVETDLETGTLRTAWRQEYVNDGNRKPGQLSAGSGTSPTIAPIDGREVVVFGDNAQESMNILLFDAFTGENLLEVPMPETIKGTEDSPIVTEDGAIIVNSTYGYTYPTGDTIQDVLTPFKGGMARFDIDLSGDQPTATMAWNKTHNSAALPRLSTPDNLIYTVLSEPFGHLGLKNNYYFAAIDAVTGDVVQQQKLPGGGIFGRQLLNNPLQMSGNIGPNGTYYQGTMGGFITVRPDEFA